MKYLLTLFFCLIAISIFASFVSAQEKELKNVPLRLTVALKGTACIGESFVLTVTLTNTGDADYVIDPIGMWMSYLLTAEDRYKGSIFIGGKVFPTPESKMGGGPPPPASADKLRRRLVRLGPHQSYTSEKTFDPTCDQFFITTGKYRIQVGYHPELADPNQEVGLEGTAESDDFEFSIKRCD